MNIEKLIKEDIKGSIQQLKFLRKWLELNIGNLTLAELKRIRNEIERMEIAIAIQTSPIN